MDRVSAIGTFGQPAPLTVVRCNVQGRVDDLQVIQRDGAALRRPEGRDATELSGRDIYAAFKVT